MFNNLKILIVTYYWPPSGGPGVQRWLKFIKYLSQEPSLKITVVSPENPELPDLDPELVTEIPQNINQIKIRTHEPFKLYKIITGKKNIRPGFFNEKNKNISFLEKFLIGIRGNLFIPDARKGWINPVFRWIKENYNIQSWDVIITTGPPHSVHIIGYKTKLNFNAICWISDFRDPWTSIDFYQKLHLTFWADQLHRKLEKKIIETSDAVVCIGKSMLEEFKKLTKNKNKFFYIPNGYDPEDFPTPRHVKEKDTHKIIFTHTGTINADRNHPIFWKALFEILKENPEIKEQILIRLVGRVDFAVQQSIREMHLENIIEIIEYVPHKKSIEYLIQSDYLLLFINNTPNAKGILTGKFFEYLGSNVPILCIGPTNGEVAEILKETQSGFIADFNDKSTIQKMILRCLNPEYKLSPNKDMIKNYSRKTLTHQLIHVVETICRKE